MWGTAICQLWLVQFLTPGLVVLAAGFTLLTVAVLCCEAEPLVRARQKFRSLPRLQQVLLVLALGVMTVSAQKSGSNAVVNAEISEEGSRGVAVATQGGSGVSPLQQEEGNILSRSISPERSEHCEAMSLEGCETPLPLSSEVSASPNFSNLRVSPEAAVTTNDLARGYAFVEARTNATVSYAMPTNGTVVGTWGKTGAYQDVVRVRLSTDCTDYHGLEEANATFSAEEGDLRKETRSSSQISENSNASVLRAKKTGTAFAFPMGDVCVTSLWTYTWGKARPRLQDRAHEIVAVGAPMSCVPGEGRLWTAATTNGSWLITWESFRAGREIFNAENEESQRRGEEESTSQGGSGVSPLPQEEVNLLSRSGETPLLRSSVDSATSNDSVLRAKNTDPISAQIELFPNGYFITRSNDVERVYRRVNPDDWDGDGLANEIDDDPLVAADSLQFGLYQTLPDGANESAYYWVDLVVPQANAKVMFAGEGASNLVDPSFIAKAGETNRVTLLIGKSYHATCAFPFEIVDKSCVLIETHLDDGNRAADICWPVRISATGDAAFSMTVDPVCLGGGFTWTNSCCSVLGSGTSFSYSCRGRCSCTGCSASGYYGYEGFRVGCRGGSCGCSSSGDYCPETTTLDDAPYAAGISLSFSTSAVIFEDCYERAPGVWVEKNSTATYLTGVVHGGPNGGTATFVFEGRDKLDGGDVPVSVVVPAGQRYDFKIKYTGQAPSGAADDVVVRGTFTESGGEGEPIESEATLTSVRVDITAVEMTRTPMPEHRRTFGVREIVSCRHEPSSADFSFSMNASDAVTDLTEGRVYCPWTGGTYVLRMTVRNAAYFQALRVVEPRVVCREAVWNGVVGTVGCAGQVGMNLSLYVEPSTVSFSGVYMVEVADDEVGVRTGYFADGEAEKVGELSHTEAAGAGVWIQVHGDEWAMDAAGRATIYPTPWCEGRKEWRIPVGWGDYLHQLKGSVRPDPTTQVFTLKEDGTASVSKYGHVIERRTDNKVYLDGVLQD